MFGVSFLELAVIAIIALIVVGPQKLPTMMRTVGEWLGKLRRLTSDMRAQTGIDDILREEGIDGVVELRNLLRVSVAGSPGVHSPNRNQSRYSEAPDASLEFPVEGADASGAMPEDLFLLGSSAETSNNNEVPALESAESDLQTSTSDSIVSSPSPGLVPEAPQDESVSSEVIGTTSTPQG